MLKFNAPSKFAFFKTRRKGEGAEERTLFLLLALERLLNNPNQATQGTKELAKAKAPALDADSVDEEVDQNPVGDNKDAEDTEISPCLAGLDVEGGKVAVAGLVGTVLAIGGSIRVEEVTA